MDGERKQELDWLDDDIDLTLDDLQEQIESDNEYLFRVSPEHAPCDPDHQSRIIQYECSQPPPQTYYYEGQKYTVQWHKGGRGRAIFECECGHQFERKFTLKVGPETGEGEGNYNHEMGEFLGNTPGE